MTFIKPSIILVRAQLPENIGMVARAMDNFGLKKLILVNPREKWPNTLSVKSSANSKKIITNAIIYDSLNEALKNFHFVIATSNRKRFLNKPHINNNEELFEQIPENKKVAFVFGPENSGLSNEDLSLVDIIFNINTDKSNQSLNLSHAVIIMAYSWRKYFIIDNKKPKNNSINNLRAPKKDFLIFAKFLKKELNEVGFLHPKEKSKVMFENIQTMLLRASLSKIEINTLWGMVKKLRK